MGVLVKNKINYTGSGAKEEIITYAQYLALSEEQRNNGTTYYVNDINGDGEDFQPIIYGEEEREIGVWCDGKPLYQKTLHFTTTSSTNTYTHVPHNISNADTIFIHDAFIQNSSTSFILSGYKGDAAANEIIGLLNHIDNTFDYKCGASAINSDACITLQYTKTTDQPGSGTWTPQGVPAQHYSTNEQVVGTWIDGKTLYEKTYKFTAPSGATTGTTLTSVADLSIDYVASLQAIAVNPTTHRTWPLSSNYSNGGGIVILSGNDNNDNIEYRCYNDNFAGYELIVTIRYTKSS